MIHKGNAVGIKKIRSDGAESVNAHIHWDGRFQFNHDL
jgi:hypothetical protein